MNWYKLSYCEKKDMKGGLADKSGKKPSDFPKDKIEEGKDVEKEHTNNEKIQAEITADHLVEDENYYKNLAKFEKGKDKKK